MTSILLSHRCNWSFQEHCFKERFDRVPCSRYSGLHLPSSGLIFVQGPYLAICHRRRRARKYRPPFCDAVDDRMNSDDPEDENDGKESPKGESGGVNSEMIRKNLEKIVGKDDSGFSGLDLATLIRNKYGKSYDVQLIKKEFMGRNLLALNVMWKYMEQDMDLGTAFTCLAAGCRCSELRSFPLTEEEYILRLDDVANTLKCWGAVSHIRSSLEKSKERPRIGKAVSIFIDMDESGGRANEWIYK